MKDILLQLCTEDLEFKQHVECTELNIENNQVITTYGQPVKYIYLIKQGNVRISSDPNELEPDVAFAILGPGEIFGEMSMFSDYLASAQVTAISQVTLLQFDKVEMEKFFETHPSVGYHFVKLLFQTLANRVRTSNTKIEDLFLWGGSKLDSEDTTDRD